MAPKKPDSSPFGWYERRMKAIENRPDSRRMPEPSVMVVT